MLHLKLDRPLAVFDIESTGINRKLDRIIDIAVVKISLEGAQTTHDYRVHPGCPIPPESTEIHGISDEDVKDAPRFEAIAGDLARVLENCDLGGFNLIHFDIPMLCEEFARADIAFSMEGRRILDAQRIYHKKEPRDLSAAVEFFCHEKHDGAHGALADALATFHVLEGQLEKYDDLPREVAALSEYCNPRNPAWADQTGKLKWAGKEIVINFGKNQGRSLRLLSIEEPGFLRWMVKSDFPRDTREIVSRALAGYFPDFPL